MNSFAQEPDSVQLMVEEETGGRDILSDTTLYVTDINIPADSIATWKNNRRFAYMSNLDSLLKVQQEEELKSGAEQVGRSNTTANFFTKLLSSGILKVLLWFVAIAFVLFVLYRVFISNGIFRGKVTASPVKELPEENLARTVDDYDKLIGQAIDKSDYRLAVRYLFLKTLVNLADHEYIQYSGDKTDYQYVQEIKPGLQNEFSGLVLNYEYVWYGNFPLAWEGYAGIERKFRNFNSKIL